MVKTNDLPFTEPKKLPKRQVLRDDFGIDFNSALQRFQKKLNNSILISEMGVYSLADFVLDYYEKEFGDFKLKFERLLNCKLNDKGYVIGKDGQLMSIRNLAYFANKEMKFAKELGEGRDRGVWVNTIHQDVAITTSQTGLIVDFINRSIEYEELRSNDIVMLKYLKRIDNETYSIY